MALWIKNDDGSIEKVAGSGGGGGSFEGEHVLTGDVDNPPEDLAVGQLMWDGVEGGSGGGDAGPHDHDEFAPVEHDHATETISPEIVNIRQGPFPENLVGMPELAMYDRTGSIQMSNRSNATFKIGPDANWEGKRPVYNGFVIETGLEVHGESASTQPISIIGSGGLYLNGGGNVGTPPVRMGTLMLAGDPQVTGDLQVDGNVRAAYGSKTAPAYSFIGSPSSGMYGHADFLGLTFNGNYKFVVNETTAVVYEDLQVDGNSDITINVPADFWQAGASGTVFNKWGMVGSTMGGHAQSMTSNGYRNKDNKWTSMEVNNHVGGVEVSLEPTGRFNVRVSADFPTGSPSNPNSRFTVTESGPTFRAMPSKTRTVDDILERAETAEFPPEDDDGVATMDGHDEVPLFEVVTALLAKVKELSAEIEELKAKDRPLKKQAAPRKRSAKKTTTAKKEDS